MDASRYPRAVVVTRPTEVELLLARHGTRDQARFFLETRGQAIQEAERRHRSQEAALGTETGHLGRCGDRRRVVCATDRPHGSL